MNGWRARNRAFTDVFEPVSTLKPFTIAAALEAGGIKPDTVFETAPGTFSIGKAIIRDAHKEGPLTVTQVIQKSSNVGSAKIALSLPPQTLWGMLNDSGFGASTGSGFPGEVSGKPAYRYMAPHRAGYDVIWPRHRGEPAAVGARLYLVLCGGGIETDFPIEA